MKRKGNGSSLMNGKKADPGFDLTVNLQQCFVITALLQELIQRNHPLNRVAQILRRMQSNHISIVIHICTQLTNFSMSKVPKMLQQRGPTLLSIKVCLRSWWYCSAQSMQWLLSQTFEKLWVLSLRWMHWKVWSYRDRYKTVQLCKDFTKVIGDVERQKIIDQFNNSSFVAIIFDCSIDSAVIDNEIVFIQICTARDIHTDFLRCCQKLVALGSDGASVMTGKKSGVITLLQGDKPTIIWVQCFGHRLELK